MVITDDYSRFPEIEIIRSTSASTVIPRVDAIFSRHGIPDVVRTDNGPPFNSEIFTRWSKTVGFHHRKITPLWPRANSEVERFMRTIEKAIRTAMIPTGSWKQQLYKFLRHYRATPHSTTGFSPAELLYKRKIKTELPIAPSTSNKKTFGQSIYDAKEILRQNEERMKSYMKQLADLLNNAESRDLQEGDRVLIKQDRSNQLSTPFKPSPYEVINCKGSMITVKRGDHEVTRNSSFFKKITPTCGSMPGEADLVLDESGTPVRASVSGTPNSSTHDQTHNIPNDSDTPDSMPSIPQTPELKLNRPIRNKKTPKQFEDFIPK